MVGVGQPCALCCEWGLRVGVRSGALGASIKVGEFTNLGNKMTLRIEESRDNGRSLYGIFVCIAGKGGQALAVTAAQGTFLATDDPDTIIFRLTNGVLVHDYPKYEAPPILTSNYPILPPQF